MNILAGFLLPHPPLIIKEVGRGQENEIEKTIEAYRQVGQKISELKPDTMVIISPHSIMYSDYFHISPGSLAHGDFSNFGVEKSFSLQVDYDQDFVKSLSERAMGQGIMAGTQGEKSKVLDHGSSVPIAMIKEYYGAFKVVRIGISGQSLVQHYRLGKIIAQTAKTLNKKIVVIASGDMSHKLLAEGPYGYAPEGPVFDEKIQHIVKTGNFQELLEISGQFCEEAAECGLRPLVTLAGALDGRDVDSKALSYEGPFGVGYLVASFLPLGENPNRHFDVSFEKGERQRLEKEQSKEDAFVQLARKSLETKIKEKREIGLDEIPQELVTEDLREKQAGVFVTLKKHGELRGCIGTTFPVQKSIGWEILRNAISAGLEDPRFDSVSLEELPFLEYSVDVLGNAEVAATMDDLDPVEYGVIVESGYRKGLLLPNLEGVETPEQQVSIALKKAGIREGEPYTMKRFKVTRHK